MIEQLDWNDVEPSLQFTQNEQRLLFDNYIDTDVRNEVRLILSVFKTWKISSNCIDL